MVAEIEVDNVAVQLYMSFQEDTDYKNQKIYRFKWCLKTLFVKIGHDDGHELYSNATIVEVKKISDVSEWLCKEIMKAFNKMETLKI
jgi:hypothetical protein